MEHTRGEWVQGKSCDSIVVKEKPQNGAWYEETYDETDRAYYGGWLIAESVRPCDRPLIKTAPDLLAACEDAVALFGMDDEANTPGTSAWVWLQMARTAIAKAKEESWTSTTCETY